MAGKREEVAQRLLLEARGERPGCLGQCGKVVASLRDPVRTHRETGPERGRSFPKSTQPLSGRGRGEARAQASHPDLSRRFGFDGSLCLSLSTSFPRMRGDLAREGPGHKLTFPTFYLPGLLSFLQLCTELRVSALVCNRGLSYLVQSACLASGATQAQSTRAHS